MTGLGPLHGMKPQGFRHGGTAWKIGWQDDSSFKEDYRGRTFTDHQEIVVNSTLPVERQRLCLLHELLHACSDSVLDNDSYLTEAQVRAVSHGLFDVLVNNPDVARFIVGGQDAPEI